MWSVAPLLWTRTQRTGALAGCGGRARLSQVGLTSWDLCASIKGLAVVQGSWGDQMVYGAS